MFSSLSLENIVNNHKLSVVILSYIIIIITSVLVVSKLRKARIFFFG